MPFAIDQLDAEARTREIRAAIAAGDLAKARALAARPAFVYLCYRLNVHTKTALLRLIEANALSVDPTAS